MQSQKVKFPRLLAWKVIVGCQAGEVKVFQRLHESRVADVRSDRPGVEHGRDRQENLGVGPKTVESHRKAIRTKLNVQTSTNSQSTKRLTNLEPLSNLSFVSVRKHADLDFFAAKRAAIGFAAFIASPILQRHAGRASIRSSATSARVVFVCASGGSIRGLSGSLDSKPIDYWSGNARTSGSNKDDGSYAGPSEIIATPSFIRTGSTWPSVKTPCMAAGGGC